MKVYLAGPDVFLKDPKAHFEALRAICRRYGITPLTPLDNELPKHSDPRMVARDIYCANVALIRECDAVLANLEPFRGPSTDVGTAVEIGMAHALGKPVFGYSNVAGEFYKDRLDFAHTDDYFPVVEDFGLYDNLMVDMSLDGEQIFDTFTEALFAAKLNHSAAQSLRAAPSKASR